MKITTKIIAKTCLAILLMSSCEPAEISDQKEFLKFLSDKKNGLVNEKTVSGIKYKVKYLPAEYLASNTFNSSESFSQLKKDSIIRSYSGSLTFLLNIGPADGQDFDITKVGVNSYEEFSGRIEQMAFDAQEWISLNVKGREYKPTIVRMENLNALEKSRNFIVVFSSEKDTPADLRKNDLCFTYDDEMFNTGLNNFIFKADDINSVPKFKF